MIMLLTAAQAAGGAPGVLIDRIAAVVNDDVITLSEVEAAVRAFEAEGQGQADRSKLREQVLNDLIAERLLEQQISASDVTVDDAEIDRAVQDILRQNEITEDQLQQALDSRGMTMGQYREDLRDQLLRLRVIDRNVRSRVSISDEDVREEYERRTRNLAKKEIIRISHILIPFDGDEASANAKALAARSRVIEGEPFAEVASDVSKGPTASSGGSLGEVDVAGLVPEFKMAVSQMRVGDVSEPIAVQDGFHILVLQDRRFDAGEAYESVAANIRDQLYQREVERQMQIWLEEVEAASAVERRL
ncbi:MAG: hypothetical protein HC923_11320 [Myxococcales bacterium]|nr:hypothetical protein [Myxococcales bacterium]